MGNAEHSKQMNELSWDTSLPQQQPACWFLSFALHTENNDESMLSQPDLLSAVS